MYNHSYRYNHIAIPHSDPIDYETCPKLLKTFSYFRVLISEEAKKELGDSSCDELPVIPMTMDIKSKALKSYADEKFSIKNGEFLTFSRYDTRGYPKYIFKTEDGVEVVLAEGFIKKKFLFPIHRAR